MDFVAVLGPAVGPAGQLLGLTAGGPLVLVDRAAQTARAVPSGMAAAGLAFLLILPAGPAVGGSAGSLAEAARLREQRLADAVATAASAPARPGGEGSAHPAGSVRLASLPELPVAELLRLRDELDGTGYRLVRHVVTEGQRLRDALRMLRDEGAAGLGDLLFESHRSLRDDLGLSRPELDLAVEISQNYGALGARMTTEGDAVALVPLQLISQVQVAVDGAFSEHGYAPPEMRTVVPDDGAALPA